MRLSFCVVGSIYAREVGGARWELLPLRRCVGRVENVALSLEIGEYVRLPYTQENQKKLTLWK